MRTDWLALAILGLAIAGCATSSEGPRPIAAGTPCARCGMRIEDLRFGCEDEQGGSYRAYDSIECLLQADQPAARSWLADYDTRTLHAAESTWVVKADIPSPMGGGYVAFLDRSSAEEIAASRHGRVARLSAFVRDSALLQSEERQP